MCCWWGSVSELNSMNEPGDQLSLKSLLVKLSAYCAYQERSTLEVMNKLDELEAPEHLYQSVIDWLHEEKFLNEERFAHSYVRGKFEYKHWGKIKIKQGLRQHQVSAVLVSKAITAEISAEAYFDKVLQLAHKKWAALGEENTLENRGKLSRYLSSKGFEFSIISDVLAELAPR